MAQKRKWRESPGVRLRPIPAFPQKSFLLALRRGSKTFNHPPVLFELHKGAHLNIGRSPAGDVKIDSTKVSGKHLELRVTENASGCACVCACDVSTNGTGFREGPADEFGALGREKAKPLNHGAELLMPFSNAKSGAIESEDQTALVLNFPEALDVAAKPLKRSRRERDLPDAYNELTRSGRWRYYECIGEGGLGTVYRAFDMTSGLGTVAIKISKWGDESHGGASPREAWQVYILHREAQWSLQYLHKVSDTRYDAELASLFIRYLEDHTGFRCYESQEEFEATRWHWEQPDFDWASVSFNPPLPQQPYVVMELAPGALLQKMKGHEVFSPLERRILCHQAAAAIGYLGSFGMVHRDFRGSNIHVVGRGEWCRLKALDLGLCILADDGPHMVANNNLAVQASWHRQSRQYDWVPSEVMKTMPRVNFAHPLHSFDVYSLGVFMLRLHGGKEWAREMLRTMPIRHQWHSELRAYGLDPVLLARILGKACERPTPCELASILFQDANFKLENGLFGSEPRKIPQPQIVVAAESQEQRQSVEIAGEQERPPESQGSSGASSEEHDGVLPNSGEEPMHSGADVELKQANSDSDAAASICADSRSDVESDEKEHQSCHLEEVDPSPAPPEDVDCKVVVARAKTKRRVWRRRRRVDKGGAACRTHELDIEPRSPCHEQRNSQWEVWRRDDLREKSPSRTRSRMDLHGVQKQPQSRARNGLNMCIMDARDPGGGPLQNGSRVHLESPTYKRRKRHHAVNSETAVIFKPRLRTRSRSRDEHHVRQRRRHDSRHRDPSVERW